MPMGVEPNRLATRLVSSRATWSMLVFTVLSEMPGTARSQLVSLAYQATVFTVKPRARSPSAHGFMVESWQSMWPPIWAEALNPCTNRIVVLEVGIEACAVEA